MSQLTIQKVSKKTKNLNVKNLKALLRIVISLLTNEQMDELSKIVDNLSGDAPKKKERERSYVG